MKSNNPLRRLMNKVLGENMTCFIVGCDEGLKCHGLIEFSGKCSSCGLDLSPSSPPECLSNERCGG